MAVSQAELDDFHQFASQRIGTGQSQATLDDLVMEWESLRDRDEINAAIREGFADVDAGRHRPATEVLEEIRRKRGISAE
jgi:predicted transcriptional regulator